MMRGWRWRILAQRGDFLKCLGESVAASRKNNCRRVLLRWPAGAPWEGLWDLPAPGALFSLRGAVLGFSCGGFADAAGAADGLLIDCGFAKRIAFGDVDG